MLSLVYRVVDFSGNTGFKSLFSPYLLVMFLGLALFSCKSVRSVINEDTDYSYSCRKVISFDTPEILDEDELTKNLFLRQYYTDNDIILANAFGLIGDLDAYERIKQRIDEEGEDSELLLELFTIGNRINEGMDLALLEVESVEDLLECTIFQLEKFKARVARANLDSENKLNNAATVLGGAATVITAGVLISNNNQTSDGDFFDWLAVATGVPAVYLAIRAGRVDKRISLEPRYNFVEAIYNNEDSQKLFAPSLWYLMNYPLEVEGEKVTIREAIVEEWKTTESILGNPENQEYLPILLNGQGEYTEEMIEVRINMLESLSNNLNLVGNTIYQFNVKRY